VTPGCAGIGAVVSAEGGVGGDGADGVVGASGWIRHGGVGACPMSGDDG
jgi:hypothetical protein